MTDDLQALRQDIESLKVRNSRVETDKAWETSRTRKIAVALATFAVIWAYLAVIGTAHPFLNALVPAGAFLLSTLTLPVVRRVWMERRQP